MTCVWYNVDAYKFPRVAANNRGNDQPFTEVSMSTVTHKACTRCGETKPVSEFGIDRSARNGLTSQCVLCRRANTKRWQQEHPERKAAYGREWREKNRDYDTERKACWYRENPERSLSTARAWRQANPERVRIRHRNYCIREHDRVRAIANRRRARKHAQQEHYTLQQWEELKAFYDFTCLCCGRREPEIKLTADHVVPLARLGRDDISNIQPLCGRCNRVKNVKIIDYRNGRLV